MSFCPISRTEQYSPPYANRREHRRKFHFSRGLLLEQLEDMHYIERDNHISRSIRILHAILSRNSVAEKVGRAVNRRPARSTSSPSRGRRIVATRPSGAAF
jgi:hypothetical protein